MKTNTMQQTVEEKIKRKKRIGNRLRAARENSWLSQGQVAQTLGYHRPTITAIEAGRRSVKAEELVHFCYLYNITYEWLLDD
jgi:transcriptional regulator with XRE-family HTH domain